MDFQLSPVPSFDGTEPTPTGLSMARFEAGSAARRIMLDLDAGATNLVEGLFIRPAYGTDNQPTGDMTISGQFG